MASEVLTLHDVVLPFVGAAAGYIIGVLQTTAANMRERRKALNGVLYSLLQMRREVRISNPHAVVLPQINELISKRFGPAGVATFAQIGVPTLLYPLLQEATGTRLSSLTEQYKEAVRALIPVDPVLAYSLAGDRITQLELLVRGYYQRIRERPDVARDPNAPAILAVMEDHTLDLAFNETLKQLADDIRTVAHAFWKPRRGQILQTLERQDEKSAQLEDGQVSAQLDLLFQKVAATLQPSSSGSLASQ